MVKMGYYRPVVRSEPEVIYQPIEGAAFISRLPVELLRKIVLHLEREDLKSLRRMDRKTQRVASEMLFDSIEVRGDKSSQKQLQNIIDSSFWYLQVHTINWYIPRDVHDLPNDFDCRYASHWQSELLQKLPALHTIRFQGRALKEMWRYRGNWELAANPGKIFYYDLYRPIHVTHLKPKFVQIGLTDIFLT